MSSLRELFEKGKWYHCFRHEGMMSNGTYDVEKLIPFYKFERDYSDKTVLDVGCSDGYFSIWMKEHGAKQVTAIDLNKYDGSIATEAAAYDKTIYENKYSQYVMDFSNFRSVYEQYGLKDSNKLLLMSALKNLEVDFKTGTVYDLKPYGIYDLVMCNDLLEHLRDPITAIEQLYSAVAENGKCIITTISPSTKESFLNWQKPVLTYQGHISSGNCYILSEASLVAMCQAAGFRKTEVVSRFEIHNRMHNVKMRLYVVHAYK